ncbi:MAG: NYN domain-containing protein [Chloroflexi bacterium]|nr:NYN domain-containing protein [Chloroflexota bacterium]
MANVRFYIDGLNLYYGALRKTPHRWLNIHELCRRIGSPGDQINRIRYFTSDVKNTGRDGRQRERQLIYLRALDTIGGVVGVHKGRFVRRKQQMELVAPIVEEGSAEPTESVLVYRTEEKGSDVNLATYLMLDAARRAFQSAYVVSNDTDLVEPIRLVRSEFGRPVHVIRPKIGSFTHRMNRATTTYSELDHSLLPQCQFPEQLVDGHGCFHRPRDWE